MNLEILKSENGFVTQDDFTVRMSHRTPPDTEKYLFRKVEGTSFSEVAAVVYGKAYPLFKIWTGNKHAYSVLQSWFHRAAKLLWRESESHSWKKDV